MIEKDRKNPKKWIPAHLNTVTDVSEHGENGNLTKIKYFHKILKQCNTKKDGDLADEVRLRVAGAPSDLHDLDARYHRGCYCRFFSN